MMPLTDRQHVQDFRSIAEQALSRAAGAPLSLGNRVDLLIDAPANFAAWLEAIAGAQRSILFGNYIFRDDDTGREFVSALAERARAGVAVHVLHDWLGCLGQSRSHFWQPLREAGGEVRTYNPFDPLSPFGWINRDHRKLLSVDGRIGFVSGVCVSSAWLGDPARGRAPWRDTGVALRGPAVADIERAFADTWAMLGEPLPESLLADPDSIAPAAVRPAWPRCRRRHARCRRRQARATRRRCRAMARGRAPDRPAMRCSRTRRTRNRCGRPRSAVSGDRG